MASADNVPACKGATWNPRSPTVCNFWDSDGTKYDGVCDQDGGCVRGDCVLREPERPERRCPWPVACLQCIWQWMKGEEMRATRPPHPAR